MSQVLRYAALIVPSALIGIGAATSNPSFKAHAELAPRVLAQATIDEGAKARQAMYYAGAVC